jgi:hypothetical protein
MTVESSPFQSDWLQATPEEADDENDAADNIQIRSTMTLAREEELESKLYVLVRTYYLTPLDLKKTYAKISSIHIYSLQSKSPQVCPNPCSLCDTLISA